MAGHSKWANIKHRKEKSDAQKGKLFSRAAKEIVNSVKHGGSDPKSNTRLRLAIQKAREVNFPADNIERLIKKTSSGEQEAYHFIQYELYGHGGVGIILDTLTDNKNRISSDIRTIANKKNVTIAVPGAVAFNFDRKGILTIPKEHAIEEELFAAAIEAGAEDFQSEDGLYIIITSPTDIAAVKEAIEKLGFKVQDDTIAMIPKTYVDVSDEVRQQNLTLLELLDEIDDVEASYHNMKMD